MDLAKVVSTKRDLPVERRHDLADRAPARRARRSSACTSSPTTSASSATSCACSPIAAAASRSCPRRRPPSEVLALSPDGVFLSNGPGDPEPCDYAIEAIRELLETELPIFGICLGHQLLGLASGAQHGEDEVRPSRRESSGAGHRDRPRDDHAARTTASRSTRARCRANVKATHRSLFDGSLQGIARTDRPAFSFQGHPEASPGPHDVRAAVRPLHRS